MTAPQSIPHVFILLGANTEREMATRAQTTVAPQPRAKNKASGYCIHQILPRLLVYKSVVWLCVAPLGYVVLALKPQLLSSVVTWKFCFQGKTNVLIAKMTERKN